MRGTPVLGSTLSRSTTCSVERALDAREAAKGHQELPVGLWVVPRPETTPAKTVAAVGIAVPSTRAGSGCVAKPRPIKLSLFVGVSGVVIAGILPEKLGSGLTAGRGLGPVLRHARRRSATEIPGTKLHLIPPRLHGKG